MNNKPLKKVCTKCLDANKQLQLNADFFVEVQYGICDCCGNRGIVIPFERFFNTNTKLTPHVENRDVEINSVDLSNFVEKRLYDEEKPLMRKEIVEEIMEEVKEVKTSLSTLRDYVRDIGGRVVNPEPSQPKNNTPKQPKNAKVDGDAAYE